MVPTICSYKWHSNGLKAHIPGEVFYCLCSKCEVCHPGHTRLSTVVIWVKKRRGAAAESCHYRPPFLQRCLRLRVGVYTKPRVALRGHARHSVRTTALPIGCCHTTSGIMLPSSVIDAAGTFIVVRPHQNKRGVNCHDLLLIISTLTFYCFGKKCIVWIH